MRVDNIRIGMALKLNPKRADAYGLPRDLEIVVEDLKWSYGYKTPWIIAEQGAFKPADFSKATGWAV